MKRVKITLNTSIDCSFSNAVKPDDVDLPDGMEIRHECLDNKWHISITYVLDTPKDILTLRNTLDEIVRSLQVIDKVILRQSSR
ncbi:MULTISPECIES: KEOPS complex subunit Pcc1 [Pyrobaculum]|uniref:KEOPS complex Pcc1-like subunit n=2 Tax=Pyrobaculum arsenaticum TaxID=121277 RepID=A4WMA4_PYRAR|nr:KEOPS complex subunit Pcc1 [Pyrobaculum arsenaticum]ABP51521.1 conserved hypothetical protein [Pyrobaculum arsenaticum DSM 13514]MCY0890999.1 KEOPS complex subunit Pcc1 [Pyrobaculum arsenaticum]NYR16510.1 KEOPS complex Pcc1-like subunit [Pyrobaculum arsenaticum]